jgi:hypothetical protein
MAFTNEFLDAILKDYDDFSGRKGSRLPGRWRSVPWKLN